MAAFPTNAKIWALNTAVNVIDDATATVADDEFYDGTGNAAYGPTQHENADTADATLTLTLASSVLTSPVFNLYRTLPNEEVPLTSDKGAAKFVGSFTVAAGATEQTMDCVNIPIIPGVDNRFWVENKTGVSTAASSQITLTMTARTETPKT